MNQNYESRNIRRIFFIKQMRILNVVCRWAGSTHDATISGNSRFAAKMEAGYYGTDSVILGDSAYAPKSYICKPLRNPRNDAEKSYQKAQIKSRNVVERTFGVLKRRFPCLQMGMHVNVEKVQDIVVACCILHNMFLEYTVLEEPIQEQEIEQQIEVSDQLAEINQPGNRQMRIQDFLIQHFFY